MTCILVVEDDADIRDSLVEALQSEGYEASGTEDGDAALRLLRSGAKRPALILLDIMMPRMDGVAFCEALRADTAFASIPVVVISADAHLANRATQMRAAGFLRKPVRLADLFATVARFA